MFVLEAITAPREVILPDPAKEEETSAAVIEELNITGAFTPSTQIIFSLPSKLYLSKWYLAALVLPVSLTVQFSDTTSNLVCAAAVVLEVALVTPVKVVALTPV
jgi:hypothetical protein